MRSRIACGLSPVSAFKAIWISPALTVAMSSPPSVFSTVPALEQDLTRRSGSLARAHVLKTGYRKLDPEKRTRFTPQHRAKRSEEHTSELQSLMRISYAVFCLKKKK